jgi:hypothetical protein
MKNVMETVGTEKKKQQVNASHFFIGVNHGSMV